VKKIIRAPVAGDAVDFVAVAQQDDGWQNVDLGAQARGAIALSGDVDKPDRELGGEALPGARQHRKSWQ